MGLKKEFKERVKDAEAKSHFIPWKRRWWGRMIIGFIVLFIILFIYFVYLIFNNYNNLKQGNIYNKELGDWITIDQFKDNQKIIGELMTEDDPWLGSEEPLIYIVGYESFGCPYCKDDQADLMNMITKFSSIIRYITKDFPTEGLHEDVFNAHLAAACANEQGVYWEYRSILFDNQGNFDKNNLKLLAKNLGLNIKDFNSCLDNDKYSQEIRQDYANGVQSNVSGTPSYIVNGQLITGTINYETWETIIALILKKGF